MLSPSNIKDKKRKVKNDRMSVEVQNNQITSLYMEVLNEIKSGSIDPKSLALEVLKITPTWYKR